MRRVHFFATAAVGITAALFGFGYVIHPPAEFSTVIGALETEREKPQKTPEERIREAEEKSQQIKALYMTADVANDPGAGATRLRNEIIATAEETEINGIVIDVKEVCGPDYDAERLGALLNGLREKNIWAIARIVVFKDGSQIYSHPDWYLTRANPKPAPDECSRKKHLRLPPTTDHQPPTTFWRDNRGGYWLDPASPEARNYLISFSKKMIDLGFDELQFDYIRFPSDGDVSQAIYPAWDKKTPKHIVIGGFFEDLRGELKTYKPEIILSADLFGYVASQHEELSIGQRLEDIGENFDYVSFMVYPSHYYNGLALPPDPSRGLPPVNFSVNDARTHPDVVVYRSLLYARDFLDGKLATTTNAATATQAASTPQETQNKKFRAKFRPWLEDFFHEQDQAAGRPYGAEKVKMQIEAAERAEPHGWMLWNAANVYTESILKKEQ